MIPDHQTNTLYLADKTIKHFPRMAEDFRNIVEDAGYPVKIIQGTADYYCRDYMPLQVSKYDFVQFEFKPEKYLEENEYKYISDPVKIQKENTLQQPRKCEIILDGGNVIKWIDKVIITDRVYKDNEKYFNNNNAIHKELEKEMKCKVIIIPEYPKEKTGHADGLVRFIDEKRVFINETNGDPEKEWLDYFLKVLKENKLEPFELPCQAPATQKAANGLYINYMHIGKLILVPQFKGYGDDNKEALKRIKGEFPKEYKVKPYPANWIAKYGGVFNCMSWNILA